MIKVAEEEGKRKIRICRY